MFYPHLWYASWVVTVCHDSITVLHQHNGFVASDMKVFSISQCHSRKTVAHQHSMASQQTFLCHCIQYWKVILDMEQCFLECWLDMIPVLCKCKCIHLLLLLVNIIQFLISTICLGYFYSHSINILQSITWISFWEVWLWIYLWPSLIMFHYHKGAEIASVSQILCHYTALGS